ncbi:hypothetical protein FLL45_05665 [Aliikangiella marina]|uniref:DNA-directed DNA polymerase n=1 Tax=Aliikangiella marina TaxID=1712262 RepID=A0A545TJU3_9GAMM|nr:hypothetical protein [Aliikangiella marina]TQV77431.1 hypothetical protein FLL45_05665 [Aliikangiella marina]
MLTEYPWFDNINENLSQALLNERMPHALMIQSPPKSGKAAFAFGFAKSLLCSQVADLSGSCGECKSCQLFDAGTHPDFYGVDKLVDAKGKQKKSIGIEQVRELTANLRDTAQLGGFRIALVHSVEAMTTASFNALLKTLEEPGKDTILVLLANNQASIPATIRSRCQLIKPELTGETLIPWLQSQVDAPEIEVKDALDTSYWAPLAALEYLNEEGASLVKSFFDKLDRVLLNQLTPVEFLDQVDSTGDSIIDEVTNYFYHVEKCQALKLHQDRYQRIPHRLIFQIYAKLLELKRAQQAGSNLQTRLQIEVILIQWFEFGKKLVHYSNS